MNIVFDIGNVLLAFSPGDFLEQIFDDREEAAALMNTVFRSEEWILLDRGAISPEQARQNFALRLPGREAAIERVMRRWVEMLKPIDATTALLPALGERHRLYYLSNMPRQATAYILEKFNFWPCFDGGIFSYTTGLVKPEAAIYTMLLEQYRLDAADCVFIDDMPVNVNAAIRLGMRGIVFDRTTDLTGLL